MNLSLRVEHLTKKNWAVIMRHKHNPDNYEYLEYFDDVDKALTYRWNYRPKDPDYNYDIVMFA